MRQQINLDHSDVLAAVQNYVEQSFSEHKDKDVRVRLYVDDWSRVVAIATVEEFDKEEDGGGNSHS